MKQKGLQYGHKGEHPMPRPHTSAPLMRLRIDGRLGNAYAIVPGAALGRKSNVVKHDRR